MLEQENRRLRRGARKARGGAASGEQGTMVAPGAADAAAPPGADADAAPGAADCASVCARERAGANASGAACGELPDLQQLLELQARDLAVSPPRRRLLSPCPRADSSENSAPDPPLTCL